MTKKAYSSDEKGFFVVLIHSQEQPYTAGRAGTSRLITHSTELLGADYADFTDFSI